MDWPFRKERDKWPTRLPKPQPSAARGVAPTDRFNRDLYEQGLPRGVRLPRFTPDRPRVNYFMPPEELARFRFEKGQIIVGKLGDRFIGHLDDRPLVTIAGPRAGKTSTALEPNLYLYPGSALVHDPKGELARKTARLRRLLGHRVFVLDPFGQSGLESACFNAVEELDPGSPNIIDDVTSIANALVPDDGDPKSRHWNDRARTLIKGIILLLLTLAPAERNLITMRQLLTLTYPGLLDAVKRARAKAKAKKDKEYFDENSAGVVALLKAMSNAGDRFGGILASVGNQFLNTPHTERGNIFSTASAKTDFFDSLPMMAISKQSDFRLRDLRSDTPVTIFLCLAAERLDTHYPWLRLIVQLACNALERMGPYPRGRAPTLFMMEEFATLGSMKIMERAAAYFPGFGIKLWVVLQDINQLKVNYSKGWETFLGAAGLIQCFANGDQETLEYLSRRMEKLMEPFELRYAFAREKFTQLLLFAGEAPAAALRLQHHDVDRIRAAAMRACGLTDDEAGKLGGLGAEGQK